MGRPPGERYTFVCQKCHKEFSCARWQIRGKNRERQFCSGTCRAHAKGRFSNRFTGGIARNCLECGKEFRTVTSKLEQGHGRYCSYSCRSAAITGDRHPKYNGHKSHQRAAQARNTANVHAKRLNQLERLTNKEVEECIFNQQGRCSYCSVEVRDNFELDHKIPFSRGGLNVASNIHIVCKPCNREKGQLTHDEYLAVLAHRRRTDSWQ